jgi:hypothetical protein
MELVRAASGGPSKGDYPQPTAPLLWGVRPRKEVEAMSQNPRKEVAAMNHNPTQFQIREISLPELISIAIAKRRKLAREGKTSRRISLLLNPRLIPPDVGEYETSIGRVKVHSVFLKDRGQWAVTIVLPQDSGFQLKDHLPSQDK